MSKTIVIVGAGTGGIVLANELRQKLAPQHRIVVIEQTKRTCLLPAPQIHLRKAGKAWHAGKVFFEKWWLTEPGMRKRALGALMTTGGRIAGIPVEL